MHVRLQVLVSFARWLSVQPTARELQQWFVTINGRAAQLMVGQLQLMVGQLQLMVGQLQLMVGQLQLMVGRRRSNESKCS